MKRNRNESIILYKHRLKKASKYCEFEKLGRKDLTIEDELFLRELIEDMQDISYKHKIVERSHR